MMNVPVHSNTNMGSLKIETFRNCLSEAEIAISVIMNHFIIFFVINETICESH